MQEIEPSGTHRAVTERGTVLRHGEDEVNDALTLLALSGGKLATVSKLLKAEGRTLDRKTLREWRDVQFPRRYAQVRRELSKEVSENIAGRALERAAEADDVEAAYLQAALKRLPEVDANHLAKNAALVANAKSRNAETARLLRDQPTSIVETRTLPEMIADLERLGLIEHEPETVEGSCTEIESP